MHADENLVVRKPNFVWSLATRGLRSRKLAGGRGVRGVLDAEFGRRE